ncbi:MAG TPA: methyltransferase domain-containing protein [Polyangia bacterium]|nr:methyltransferase domain-containing protein [Polyangia bacterium]
MKNSDGLTLEAVRNYYGRVLASTKDLQTSACCAIEKLAPHLAAIEAQLHDEVKDKFYGCGAPLPPALDGATVLDLGCGSGRDTFMLSRLVGERGQVIGIDMTPEQLAVAEEHLDYHRRQWGYARGNVRLVSGYIEDLRGAGIESGSVDLVVSNCVVNLSPDKERVFAEVFRVLKPGGELYFSDVFASRRVPAPLAEDPVLLGECLGGALYWEDFRRIMARVGCADHRVVSKRDLTLDNPDIARQIGQIGFSSVTVRAFKLALEDRCEDYGQVATYLGTIDDSPHHFVLDDHHDFEAGRPMLVCGNSAAMVQETRYARHFRVTGDRSTHFGLFDCGPATGAPATAKSDGSSCC